MSGAAQAGTRTRTANVAGRAIRSVKHGLAAARKAALLLDRHLLAAEFQSGTGGLERADQQRVARRIVAAQIGGLRGQRHAARAARVAATDALVVRLPAFQGRVVAPVAAVGVLGRGKMVVEGAFQLVAEPRLAGQSQQLQIQLDPGRRDAGFADVEATAVGQHEVVAGNARRRSRCR